MGEYFKPVEETTPKVTFVFKDRLPHPQPEHCGSRFQMFGELLEYRQAGKRLKDEGTKELLPAVAVFRIKNDPIVFGEDEDEARMATRRHWRNQLSNLLMGMAEYAGMRGAEIERIVIREVHIRKEGL